MSLNKEDIWADLRYALDELERPPRNIHSRLTDAANLDVQSDDEFHNRLLLIGTLSIAYSKAAARADVRNAHEAIEKGLKAILIDSGLPANRFRRGRDGHKLHLLLAEVKKHNPTTFNKLERCFDSTIQYLESVTTLQHNTNIVDYFQKHGKAEGFLEKRYESIDGRKNTEGMIGRVYREMIRALLSLIFGRTPKDIDSRIKEEVGTHHWWSMKYLHRYVAEYVYRQNTRGISGEPALAGVIRNSENKQLPYVKLIAEGTSINGD